MRVLSLTIGEYFGERVTVLEKARRGDVLGLCFCVRCPKGLVLRFLQHRSEA